MTVGNVFDTLQSYFGTAYINDVNIGAQVNKVILQSDWAFRNRMESIGRINVRGDDESNVPMQTIAGLQTKLMPRSIVRHNMFPSAAVSAFTAPGFSTGQAMARAREIAETLPDGYRLEWSGMTYQEQQASDQVLLVIGVALLFGYLFLVAQYESWTVPLAVMFSLPVAFLGALVGIFVVGISMSIYTQLGILMLVGLSAKNATVFGIFIIPGLYVVLQTFREKIKDISGFKFEKPDWQEEG